MKLAKQMVAAMAAWALSGAALAQQPATFSVGNAVAARGQKVTGTIAVPAGVEIGRAHV